MHTAFVVALFDDLLTRLLEVFKCASQQHAVHRGLTGCRTDVRHVAFGFGHVFVGFYDCVSVAVLGVLLEDVLNFGHERVGTFFQSRDGLGALGNFFVTAQLLAQVLNKLALHKHLECAAITLDSA